MSTLFKWVAAPVLAVALSLSADAPKADAGGFSISIGGGYPSYGYNRGYSRVGGFGYSSYRPSYRSSYRSSYGGGYSGGHFGTPVYQYGRGYHPRGTHLDYHGPSLVPHGNHLDVVPGHYDVHRGGHFGH